MKIKLAIRELHRSEHKLAKQLHAIAARHHADSDICHLANDLARWSESHLRQLAEHGRHYGVKLNDDPRDSPLMSSLQARFAELVRTRPEPALMLLADLRRVHRVAAGASLDWELLGQAAQATKDTELLDLTKECHPQTLRQMRWANAMLKELSPQVLTS